MARRPNDGLRAISLSMNRPHYLPNPDRLSVLAAVMALAYLSTHFIQFPGRQFALQLPGLYLTLTLNAQTVIGLLVAGLAASGTTWLLSDHPDFAAESVAESAAHRYQLSWVLPAVLAGVAEMLLAQLPFGLQWWLGMAASSGLMILILTAEYIAVDIEDVRFPLASAGLNAAAFALLLFWASALRAANVRLYVILPALALAGGAVSLRALYLRLHGSWDLVTAAIIAILLSQFAAALHYWPLAPVTYGLLIMGAAYALTSLIGALAEGKTWRQALAEPGLALLTCLVVAWLTR